MDTLIIWLFAGVVATAYVIYDYRRGQRRLKATAKPAPKPAATEDRTQQLYRYAAAIEQFVEKSAHPRELLDNAEFKAAALSLGVDDVSLDIQRQYAIGASWPLACVALFVLAKRPGAEEFCPTILTHLPQMRPWTLYFALRYFGSLEKKRPPVGAPFVLAQYWWKDNLILPDAFREYLVRREELHDAVEFGTALEMAGRSDPDVIDNLLYRVEHTSADLLRWQLKEWREKRIDKPLLSSIGRFWTDTPEDKLLVVPEEWRDRMIEATAAILADPHRSILINGESRVGKTSFLKLVGGLLRTEGWTIFEASAAEVMAGQIYFGQLEERIREIVGALNAKKKIAWYVPDLVQMAESGTHRGQSASLLDQMFAAVTAGNLVVLSEASPAGLARLFQTRPSMRGTMELYRFHPMTEPETAEVVREVADLISQNMAMAVSASAIDTVLHLSHQYLGSTQLPGITIDLLKRSATHASGAGRLEVAPEDVLETLSQLSGLPRSILDDDQRLDLNDVRGQFETRVIGQDEAVNAVVDRIAMLKAGLVDPGRPIGVFLFAGPTGTGKTELAKTLAAYLFGSADRMARLDMSELQTPESTVKVIGSVGSEADALTDKVRKQPFSVVLLDEFEKAHSNVWDLFLQVFDDGRLTDANGRVVDFRHTIIVLTTNLGATTHKASVIGFGRSQGAYSADHIMQAVGRTFRPEFVNRLDKIIVFRPLSREFMRKILEKELALVLERRGLRQRDWAVEWEDSALSFLLDRGFTPDMGARPLRRAIDEHLLAPLAATMVEHRYPAGDQFLFVRSDGNAIQVEFVDPNAKDETTTVTLDEGAAKPSLARAILNPAGDSAESSALEQVHATLSQRLLSPEWVSLKGASLAAASATDIWQRPDRAQVFSRLELMDRVGQAALTADRLRSRFASTRGKGGSTSRELAARLALQLHLVELGIEDALTDTPTDSLVTVEPVLGEDDNAAASAEWCGKLEAMYRAWANLRHMQSVDAAAASGKKPAILHVTGFGAFRTLRDEAGLHVAEPQGESGARLVARVRVAAGPAEATPRDPYPAFERLLAQSAEGSTIVRRYRLEPAPLVRDAKKGWRSGKLDAVLAGNFDLIGML